MRSTPRSWLDVYFRVWRGNYALGSIVAALSFFVLGGVLAAATAFAGTYLRTGAVYLGTFGIAWVGACAGWGSRRLRVVLSLIRPAFQITDHRYAALTNEWTSRIYDNRRVLRFGLPFTVAFSAFVLVAVNVGYDPWLPHTWIEAPHLWVKVLVVCLYGAGVVFLVTTTGISFIECCRLVFTLAREPIVPIIDFARVTLQPLVDLSVAAALAWSVGVALFVVLFQPALNVLSAAIIGGLTAVGLAVVICPQLAVHHALERTKRLLLKVDVPSFTEERQPHLQRLARNDNDHRMYALICAVSNASTWMYGPGEAFVLLGTWFVPLLVLVIQSRLRR